MRAISRDELTRVTGGFLPLALMAAARVADSPVGNFAINQLGFMGAGLMDRGPRKALESLGVLNPPHVNPPRDPNAPTVPMSQ